MAEVETLHGVKITETAIIVTVTSNGCTEAGDFRVEVQETKPPIVTWLRTNPDPCKMIEHSVDLEFSLKLIGSAEFKVANPITSGPPRIR